MTRGTGLPITRVTLSALFVLFVFSSFGAAVAQAHTLGGASHKATYTLKFGQSGAVGTDPLYQSLLYFARQVSKDSNGDVDVQIYANSVLGTANATYTQMQTGVIQGWYGASTAVETSIPEFGIFDLPYIFVNNKGFAKVWSDHAIFSTYQGMLAQTGVKLLDVWNGGARDIDNNVRPINSPSDLKGMSIRTLASPVYSYYFSALGADPSPLAFGEVYLALQQGTLDAEEGSPAADIAAQHDQVAKYWEIDNHAIGVTPLCVNLAWFNSLPQADQKGIQEAADAATAVADHAVTASFGYWIKYLKNEGKTVIYPNLTPFRAIARGVMKHFESTFGKAAINDILHAEGQKELP